MPEQGFDKKSFRKPSLNQLAFTMKQAAYLANDSETYISKLIDNGFLSEKDGEVIRIKCETKYRVKITRKGITKLTGYVFEKLNYLEFTQEILKQISKR